MFIPINGNDFSISVLLYYQPPSWPCTKFIEYSEVPFLLLSFMCEDGYKNQSNVYFHVIENDVNVSKYDQVETKQHSIETTTDSKTHELPNDVDNDVDSSIGLKKPTH